MPVTRVPVRLFLSSASFAAAAMLAGCSSQVQQPSIPLTLSGNPANGATASPYNGSLAIAGGTAPYTCQLNGTGALPAGITLGSNCTLSGTPTAFGTFTFGVYATDSSTPVRAGTMTVSLTVAPSPVVFSSNSLPVGVVSLPYSTTVGLSGGVTPYTCTLNSGSMPAGLTLSSACKITGTPTAAATYSLSVKATDSATPQQTSTSTLSLTVVSPGALTRVMAGGQAVAGASVQIYAAGTSGNGSAPAALLATPAVTDSTGSFTIDPTKYTCPASTSLVYLVATGGQAGSNPANSGTVLMSSPGACSNLTASSSLIVNEATTVASAYAFAQFIAAGAKIGASSTNAAGLALAFGTLNNLVDVKAGTMPGPTFPTATGTAPTQRINLLARVLNGCITGSVSTACTTLYNTATPSGTTTAPSNTLDAVVNLVHNPGLDTSTLYTLAQSVPGSGYDALPSAQPSDWTLFVPFTGGGLNDPGSISIDSQGRIWVTNYYNSNGYASLFSNTGTPVFANGAGDASLHNSYGGAVDPNDNFWMANEEGGPSNLGTVTVFNPQGKVSQGSPFTQGGLNFPISVAFDTTGVAWIVDYGNSHVTLLDKNGNPQSGSSGYTAADLVFPVAIAVDGNRNGWVANQSSNTVTKVTAGGTFISYVVGSGPSGVAVDGNNNVWVANYYGDSIGMVSSAGTVLSGATGVTGGGVVHPQGIAIDGANRAWIANYRGPSLSEFSAISASTAGKALSPTAGWAPDAALLEAFGIAIDQAGNVWVSNFGNNTLTEFIGLAAPVKTPLAAAPKAP